MSNSPTFLAPERHVRICGSGDTQKITSSQPRVFLTSEGICKSMSVIQAIGFDLLVAGTGNFYCGQSVKVGFLSTIPMVELTIPGKIHWHEQKHAKSGFGIVLQDSLPKEFVVREPGCDRKSVRFETRIGGTLNWLNPNAVSTSATIVNYSREGICIQSEITPQIGTDVRFTWMKEGTAFSATGTTRWVIEQDGSRLTGCELTNSRGYSIAGVTAER